MRRLFLALGLACISASAQNTPNLGLSLPPSGTLNWGVLVNANFTTIDTWSATVPINGTAVNNLIKNLTGCGTGGNLLSPQAGTCVSPTTTVNGVSCTLGSSCTITTGSSITLTTMGTSGAATYSGGILNIPQYSAGVADVTVSVGSFAIPANTCYGSTGSTTPATFAMTGLTTAMKVSAGFTGNPSAVNGWGATGGLNIAVWPSAANTGSYLVCNSTSGSITGGAITFVMGAQ